MPIYEYYCSTCESKFELLRPMAQVNDTVSCPSCQTKARRVISVFAAVSRGEEGSGASTEFGGGGGCCGGACGCGA